MLLIRIMLMAFILFTAPLAHAWNPFADQVDTDTTNFDKNLSSADTNVQKALETINDFSFDAAPVTTKGDLYTYSTGLDRLPVGTDGQILSASTVETTGLKWVEHTNETITLSGDVSGTGTDSITTTINPDAVETAMIADNNVTADKLEDDLEFQTFPLTPSAAPDADYEVANKKYVDDVGGGFAPVGATYITQTADATLTNEQAMGALATGIVKNTTTTGVQAIAVPDTDYDSSITNEFNTIQGDDNVPTSGLAISVDGGEGMNTDVVGDVMTISGENATAANKGIATFDAADFLVTSGDVAVKADGIDSLQIEWGLGANQVSAVDVPIADAGGIITATEVEGALQENRTAIDLNTAKTTESTTVSDTNTIDLILSTYDITADVKHQNSTSIDLSDDGSGLKADLNSTLKSNYDAAFVHVSSDGSDHTFVDQSVIGGASPTFVGTNFTSISADDVNIVDSGGYYTGTEVETALQEIYPALSSTTPGSAGCAKIGIPILGTPTWTTQCDSNSLFNSTGRATGGNVTDAGSENVAVALGTGFIKATDSDIAEVLSFDWAANGSVATTTDTHQHIGIIYNAGTPITDIRASDNYDLDTEFSLASVVNEGGVLHILNNPWWVTDGLTNIIERFRAEGYIVRDNNVGGLILSVSGTRNVAVTTGVLWSNLNEFTVPAIDTAVSGTVEYYWYNGISGTWTDSDVSQYSVTQWNDTTMATLQTISNNRYANVWVYAEADDTEISIVYPQAEYVSAAGAEAEAPPTLLPVHIQEHGILIGRIIIKQATDAPVQVDSAFEVVFTASQAADHGNLSGLGDSADHAWALLIDGSRALAGPWDMGSQALTNVNMDTGDIATAVTQTEWDAAYTHVSSDGSDHTFIDQSVISGAVPTFTGTNVTGVPAANILAGTFGTGAYTFDSAVSLLNDNAKLFFGAGQDASISYDGSDLIFNSQEAGTGDFLFNGGNVIVANTLTAGTLGDGTFSVTGGVITGATNTNWDAAYSHVSSNGSDHTYIDQSVVSGATPTFTNTNFTEATDKNYVTDAELVVIGNTSGTNTGDQTSIVGITGTMAQFDTAVTGGNFAYAGGAFHDGFSDFVANEHIDWTSASQSISTSGSISGSNISGTNTGDQVSSDFNHDDLSSITGTAGQYNHPTDANMTVIGNTSGTNTGDQTTVSGNAGTATALETARAIYGNNFDGTAALTQIIASTYGGTGNGFTKFTGATTTEKTYTLPDASATLLYSGGALGTPSGGTLTNCTGLPASSITAGTFGSGAYIFDSTVSGITILTASTLTDGTMTFNGGGITGLLGPFSFTQNSDTVTLSHDGTDGYMKWNDGRLWLMTDEGTNNNSRVHIKGKGTGAAIFALQDGSSSTYNTDWFQNETISYLNFGSGVTEYVINESGGDTDLRVESDTLVNAFLLDGATGNIAIGAGQLTFPASQNASADANTLDDYEEGYGITTVVCSVSGSYTLSNNYLAYTKVGRVVHIQGIITATGEDSPDGNLRVSLPFTSATLTEGADSTAGDAFLFGAGTSIPNGIHVNIDPGNAYFQMLSVTDAGGILTISDSEVDTAWNLYVNFSYIAA